MSLVTSQLIKRTVGSDGSGGASTAGQRHSGPQSRQVQAIDRSQAFALVGPAVEVVVQREQKRYERVERNDRSRVKGSLFRRSEWHIKGASRQARPKPFPPANFEKGFFHSSFPT